MMVDIGLFCRALLAARALLPCGYRKIEHVGTCSRWLVNRALVWVM